MGNMRSRRVFVQILHPEGLYKRFIGDIACMSYMGIGRACQLVSLSACQLVSLSEFHERSIKAYCEEHSRYFLKMGDLNL